MTRVLPKPYAERDVEDVEFYVRETVGSISPYIASDEREQLVARGLVPAGAAVVLVSINPDLTRDDANYLKLKRL